MIDLFLTLIKSQAAALTMAQAIIREQAETVELEDLSDDIAAITDLMDGLQAKAEARGWHL